MARLWFSVVVLASLHHVFGSSRDCSILEIIKTCDECIRCNGVWCNTPDENGIQCSRSSDSWCTWDREAPFKLFNGSSVNGNEIYPKYLEKTFLVEDKRSIEITYIQKHLSGEPKIQISIANSTITDLTLQHVQKDFTVTKCADGMCKSVVHIMPTTDFCPSNGTEKELFTLRVQMEGVTEEFTGRFHVPCACGCSKHAERNSQKCSERGDYACGSCSCQLGWEGPSCERKMKKKPSPKPSYTNCDRGDTPLECITEKGICSNNGHCTCGKCECFTNTTTEYFGDYCEDICSYTSNCESCIRNQTAGPCDERCYFPMTIDRKNETLLRHGTWTKCNLTDECYVEYHAMKDDYDEIHVMVTKSCKGVQGAVGAVQAVNVTVPVVLGVIALVAVAATVVGYVMWKNRTPPLPLNDPGYQNIDAEDCTGINPLYKPPTSSFKNPTYGNKW